MHGVIPYVQQAYVSKGQAPVPARRLEHFPFYYNRKCSVISTEGRDLAVLFVQKQRFLSRSAPSKWQTAGYGISENAL